MVVCIYYGTTRLTSQNSIGSFFFRCRLSHSTNDGDLGFNFLKNLNSGAGLGKSWEEADWLITVITLFPKGCAEGKLIVKLEPLTTVGLATKTPPENNLIFLCIKTWHYPFPTLYYIMQRVIDLSPPYLFNLLCVELAGFRWASILLPYYSWLPAPLFNTILSLCLSPFFLTEVGAFFMPETRWLWLP